MDPVGNVAGLTPPVQEWEKLPCQDLGLASSGIVSAAVAASASLASEQAATLAPQAATVVQVATQAWGESPALGQASIG